MRQLESHSDLTTGQQCPLVTGDVTVTPALSSGCIDDPNSACILRNRKPRSPVTNVTRKIKVRGCGAERRREGPPSSAPFKGTGTRPRSSSREKGVLVRGTVVPAGSIPSNDFHPLRHVPEWMRSKVAGEAIAQLILAVRPPTRE